MSIPANEPGMNVLEFGMHKGHFFQRPTQSYLVHDIHFGSRGTTRSTLEAGAS